MDYIIIDDNKYFASQLSKKGGNSAKVIGDKMDNLGPLAERLISGDQQDENGDNTGIEENDVIFININLKTEKKSRLKQAGVELLIWLRINGVQNHCVLYSFESLHQLLNRNPKHLIATSKGTTFLQLPKDFGDLDEILNKKNKGDEWLAEEKNLKEVLKPAFNIEEVRHEQANWFGILQMCGCHRSLFPEEVKFKNKTGDESLYPADVEIKLRELNNRLPFYLYAHKFNNDTINELLVEQFEQQKEQLKKKIANLEYKVTDYGKNNPDPSNLADFLRDRNSILKENENNENWDEKSREIIEIQIKETKENIEKAEETLSQIKTELEEIENEIRSTKGNRINIQEKNKNTINDLRFLGSQNMPQILYIDDQAEKGWSEIFQVMIYGKRNHRNFHTFIPSKKHIDKLFNEVERKIEETNPDIILLDLRLFNESGVHFQVEDLSGAHLLREVRNEYPTIPIVITTASNKYWSFETLQRIGSDAYWMKEGIDLSLSDAESAQNYIDLLNIINQLNSKYFSKLHEFSNRIKIIESNDEAYWWEELHSRPNSKEEVISILYEGLQLAKKHLVNVKLIEMKSWDNNEWFFPSLIIQHLSNIIEIIHNSYKSKDFDSKGSQLFQKRNTASHIANSFGPINATNISNRVVIFWIEELIDYLTGDAPTNRVGLKIIGQE